MTTAKTTYLIRISGLVQGVGFRPFVWRLANEMRLYGCVFNDSHGVQIQLNGTEELIKTFIDRVKRESPSLARIDSISTQTCHFYPYVCFEILESEQGEVTTGCAPDVATCNNCVDELFKPNDRRYLYPFINCTDCGPRLSIIKQIPYDRKFTTMEEFKQCSQCLSEYNNPSDRRFHAQPNACPECGPQVWLIDPTGRSITTDTPFQLLQDSIRSGKIIAIKGLGGFHLVCDATNSEAIKHLRERKHRPDKAFALMVRDTKTLNKFATCDKKSLSLLNSPKAPIVLLDPAAQSDILATESIAPGQYQLGFMLPHTPIHHLLLSEIDFPVIMTSGNISGSPQAITNEDALEQLSCIADFFLMHNRPIQNRVDDSVVRHTGEALHHLRRARGYAPETIPLPQGFEQAPNLVAFGGDLKNTLCIIQAGHAIVTQHIGDLEDARTYEQYETTLDLYRNLYKFHSNLYVCDLHPEYISSKMAEKLSEEGSQLIKVQHHHAHLASCLGDNRYPLSGDSVLGICLDGTGYGVDGTLWGGEFLLGGYRNVQHLARIKPFSLIGGNRAIIEPWRCLYAILHQYLTNEEIDTYSQIVPALSSPLIKTFNQMISQEINCPKTSSAGRLFDAVAAALDCHPKRISYEGQAAIELETLALQAASDTAPYPFKLTANQIDTTTFFKSILYDLQAKRPKAEIALAFHLGFAKAVIAMVVQLKKAQGFETVALSGGVIQNQILYRSLIQNLNTKGIQVLTHKELPTNDGGLSFGQALIGAARSIK